GGVRLRRTGRVNAGVRADDPPLARLRVPRGGDPAAHTALRDVAAQPVLHGRDTGQAVGGGRRDAQGAGDGGAAAGHEPALFGFGPAAPRTGRTRRWMTNTSRSAVIPPGKRVPAK